MLVSGVMALGINVAEGSKEGEDSPEKAQEKMTVAPVAKLSAKEVEKACSIVNFCRKQLFRPDGKGKNGETIGQTFLGKVKGEKLLKKMDIPFDYTFRYGKNCITSHTTLRNEFLLITKCVQALEKLKENRCLLRWPEKAEEIFIATILYTGDSDMLRAALEMGCDANKKYRSAIGNVAPLPIVLSDFPEKEELVELLVQHGAKVNGTTPDDFSYLSVAAARGNIKSVQILLENGADPNFEVIKTPLYAAIAQDHSDIALLLLKHGANPNVQIPERLPIFETVYYNNVKILEALIKAGANIEAFNHLGLTPVEFSVINSRKEVMKCLIDHGADIFLVWCYRSCEEIDARMNEIKQVFSNPLDSTDKMVAERARAIENLRKLQYPEAREKCLKHLLNEENIGLFPCEFVTDNIIKHICILWYAAYTFNEGFCLPTKEIIQMSCFPFHDTKALNRFLSAITDRIEKLDEEYKEKFECFFRRIAEEIENSKSSAETSSIESEESETSGTSTPSGDEDVEASTDDVKREEEVKETFGEGTDGLEPKPTGYVNTAMAFVTYDRPERRGPKPIKSSLVKTPVIGDAVKEEKKETPFKKPIDTIFRLNPKGHSLDLKGKAYEDAIALIERLCCPLNQAGLKCDLKDSKGHKKLVVKNFPGWAEDLKAYNMPNRLSSSHGKNDTYTTYFDETISYLCHGLCLLAQSEHSKADNALELLKNYASEGNLDTFFVLAHYKALVPRFFLRNKN